MKKKNKTPKKPAAASGRGGWREGAGRKREITDDLRNKVKVYIGAPNVKKWNAIKKAYCDDGDIHFTKKLLEFAEKHFELLASYFTGEGRQEERCVTPDEHRHEDEPDGPPQYFICLRVSFDLHHWFCRLHTHSQLEPSAFIVHLLLLYSRWHDISKDFRPETVTKLLQDELGSRSTQTSPTYDRDNAMKTEDQSIPLENTEQSKVHEDDLGQSHELQELVTVPCSENDTAHFKEVQRCLVPNAVQSHLIPSNELVSSGEVQGHFVQSYQGHEGDFGQSRENRVTVPYDKTDTEQLQKIQRSLVPSEVQGHLIPRNEGQGHLTSSDEVQGHVVQSEEVQGCSEDQGHFFTPELQGHLVSQGHFRPLNEGACVFQGGELISKDRDVRLDSMPRVSSEQLMGVQSVIRSTTSLSSGSNRIPVEEVPAGHEDASHLSNHGHGVDMTVEDGTSREHSLSTPSQKESCLPQPWQGKELDRHLAHLDSMLENEVNNLIVPERPSSEPVGHFGKHQPFIAREILAKPDEIRFGDSSQGEVGMPGPSSANFGQHNLSVVEHGHEKFVIGTNVNLGLSSVAHVQLQQPLALTPHSQPQLQQLDSDLPHDLSSASQTYQGQLGHIPGFEGHMVDQGQKVTVLPLQLVQTSLPDHDVMFENRDPTSGIVYQKYNSIDLSQPLQNNFGQSSNIYVPISSSIQTHSNHVILDIAPSIIPASRYLTTLDFHDQGLSSILAQAGLTLHGVIEDHPSGVEGYQSHNTSQNPTIFPPLVHSNDTAQNLPGQVHVSNLVPLMPTALTRYEVVSEGHDRSKNTLQGLDYSQHKDSHGQNQEVEKSEKSLQCDLLTNEYFDRLQHAQFHHTEPEGRDNGLSSDLSRTFQGNAPLDLHVENTSSLRRPNATDEQRFDNNVVPQDYRVVHTGRLQESQGGTQLTNQEQGHQSSYVSVNQVQSGTGHVLAGNIHHGILHGKDGEAPLCLTAGSAQHQTGQPNEARLPAMQGTRPSEQQPHRLEGSLHVVSGAAQIGHHQVQSGEQQVQVAEQQCHVEGTQVHVREVPVPGGEHPVQVGGQERQTLAGQVDVAMVAPSPIQLGAGPLWVTKHQVQGQHLQTNQLHIGANPVLVGTNQVKLQTGSVQVGNGPVQVGTSTIHIPPGSNPAEMHQIHFGEQQPRFGVGQARDTVGRISSEGNVIKIHTHPVVAPGVQPSGHMGHIHPPHEISCAQGVAGNHQHPVAMLGTSLATDGNHSNQVPSKNPSNTIPVVPAHSKQIVYPSPMSDSHQHLVSVLTKDSIHGIQKAQVHEDARPVTHDSGVARKHTSCSVLRQMLSKDGSHGNTASGLEDAGVRVLSTSIGGPAVTMVTSRINSVGGSLAGQKTADPESLHTCMEVSHSAKEMHHPAVGQGVSLDVPQADRPITCVKLKELLLHCPSIPQTLSVNPAQKETSDESNTTSSVLLSQSYDLKRQLNSSDLKKNKSEDSMPWSSSDQIVEVGKEITSGEPERPGSDCEIQSEEASVKEDMPSVGKRVRKTESGDSKSAVNQKKKRLKKRKDSEEESRCLLPDFTSSEAGKQEDGDPGYIKHEMIRKTGKKTVSYECRTCQRVCKTIGNMKKHVKTHGAFECDDCRMKFKTKQGLFYHKKKKNGEKFPCEFCNFSTYYKPFLRSHLKNVHPERCGLTTVTCEVCDKNLNTEKLLQEHMKMHTKGMVEVCELCGKVFRTKQDICRHVKRVHGSATHLCTYPECTKSFTTKFQLKAHVDRIHLKVRNVKCTHCDEMFYKAHEMQLHVHVHHTKERNFVCQDCGKAFRSRNNLKIHTRLHTNEKPFKCQICDYACRQKTALNFHMRKQHQKDTEPSSRPKKTKAQTKESNQDRAVSVVCKDKVSEFPSTPQPECLPVVADDRTLSELGTCSESLIRPAEFQTYVTVDPLQLQGSVMSSLTDGSLAVVPSPSHVSLSSSLSPTHLVTLHHDLGPLPAPLDALGGGVVDYHVLHQGTGVNTPFSSH